MIENSRNIKSDSYQGHMHNHRVTQCLHERTAGPKEGGSSAAAGGAVTQSEQEPQKKEAFSVKGFVTNGFRSLAAKVLGFWNDAGNVEEGKKQGREAGTRQTEAALNAISSERNSSGQAAAQSAAREVLATAAVKSENRKNEESIVSEETARKVGNVEAAVSGGLEREQGGIKRFLYQFGGAITKSAGKLLKRERADENNLSANNTDFPAEDNSYLLDSYNKTGQYSTLAKDRSLEGSFKAKG